MSHKIVAISDATVSSPDPTCTTTETATIKQQITLLEMESVKIDAMLNATQASLQGNLWPTLIMQCVNIEFVFNRSTFTLHLHFQLQLEPQHQQQRWQQQQPCHQIQMQAQEVQEEQEEQGEQPQQQQHLQQHQCCQQPQPLCPLVTAAGLLMVRAATSLSQPRWTSIRSIFISVYFVSLFQKTWDDASSDCSCTNKARLVDIKTKAENDFIKKLTNGVSGKGRCECNQMIIVPCLPQCGSVLGTTRLREPGPGPATAPHSAALPSTSGQEPRPQQQATSYYLLMKTFTISSSDYTKNCAELTTAGEWDDVKCSTLK